jgi:hypothetical protein
MDIKDLVPTCLTIIHQQLGLDNFIHSLPNPHSFKPTSPFATMQFTSFTYLAFAAAAMMGVEALPQPQKGGKIGAGDAIAGANAAAGIAGQIAGAIPKKE